MSDNTRYVSTEQFWELMMNPFSVRTSMLSMVCGPCVYYTLEAPEQVGGFIDQKMSALLGKQVRFINPAKASWIVDLVEQLGYTSAELPNKVFARAEELYDTSIPVVTAVAMMRHEGYAK